MDPRHPELAVSRIKELIKQYDRVEKDIKTATVSNKLGQLEREGALVIQELCLVAPRLHEALIQASRNRRQFLATTPITPELVAAEEKAIVKETTKETAEPVAEVKATPKKVTKTTKKAKK